MQLLSHIIRNGCIGAALEWGLQEEDFLTDQGRALFQHILAFTRDPRTRGAQVGPNALRAMYPQFVLCDDPSMTLEAYCVLVRKNRLRIDVQGYAQEMNQLSEGDDPMKAAERGMERLKGVLALGYGSQTDVNFSSSMGRTLARYELIASGADMSVAKYPWKRFNDVTLGIQPDDYIILYGRPKSMKSWVLAYMVAHAYDQGKVPLVYTKEMTADNIFMRVAACIARIPYQEFRTGQLTPEQLARVREVRELALELRKQQDMICLNAKDAPGGADTIEWLQSKVQKYKPDLVAIDGLYLMNDSKGSSRQKDNFRVQNISRAARQMVFDTGRPVIATMQATRGAAAHKNANLDEIAYSDAVSQDTTAAIRVINEDGTITLVVGGSREFRFDGCRINGRPAEDFTYIEELDQKEIDKVKQRDERQDERDTNTRAPVNTKPKVATPDKAKLVRGEQKLLEARFQNLNGKSDLRTPRS